MLTSSLSLAFLVALASAQSSPPERKLKTIDIPVSLNARAINSRDASNTQRVSYFDANGLAIINGDVIYGTVEELEQTTSRHRRSLSLFKTQTGRLWPKGQIEYKWQSEAAKGQGRLEAWTEATKRWTNMVPFLKFVEHPSNATLVADVVTLVPTVGQNSCFSPIGKATTISANQIVLDDNCGGAGTYTHELGHSLGLYHEQQRPDRDQYITIHCENVWDYGGVPADCSQNCRGYGCNFVKLAASEADASGPYDSLSLMHYAPYEFAKGPGPAIEAKPGVPTPHAHTFPTVSDAQRVCDLHSDKCPGVCGNGIVEKDNGEECDDGNNIDGDGCSANCKREGGNPPPAQSSSTAPPPSSSTTPPPPPSSSTSTPPSTTSTSTPPPPSTCPVATCSTGPVSGCDITTTCTILGGATQGGKGQHLCACRAGYKAASGDESIQIRLPWAEQQGRVFVKPGVVCDTLCDDYTLGKDGCKAVKEVPACY